MEQNFRQHQRFWNEIDERANDREGQRHIPGKRAYVGGGCLDELLATER